MNSSREIRVPREIVNDDIAIIIGWQVTTGCRVKHREIIALLETSKAIVEVEAEAEGYLEILYPEGAEVGIGEVIGLLHPEPKYSKNAELVGNERSGSGNQQISNATTACNESRLSRKARMLIEQYGIDPGVFTGHGLVREVDVIHYLERGKGKQKKEKDAGSSAQIATPESRQGLWQDIKTSAAERRRGVIWLFFNYIWKNWLLGNLVRWAPRVGILSLHRLRGVKIGVGSFIDPAAIIETAFPGNITIGDDVRITAGVIIMTHIKPPHYLRKTGIMPSLLSPVVLEDYCFIGINAVIMPGVTVGKAAVVASGAVVVNNVPPYTMVAGNPAKIIRRFPRPEGDGVVDQ